MKHFILRGLVFSLLTFWFSFAWATNGCAAEPGSNIRRILFKITSSVLDQNAVTLPKGDPSPGVPPGGNQESIPGSASVSPVQTYFPLNQNDTKNYQGTIYGTTYYGTYTYTQVFFNGRSCYLESDSLDGSKAYFGYSGTELQMYGATVDTDSYPLATPLKILNDSILNSGGSIQSSTTLVIDGITVTLDLRVTSTSAGTVSIPLGQVANCRNISMAFAYSIPGESETLEIKDVWILAPNIGKLKIAVMDQFMIQRGWLYITGGTVGGKAVAEIINPTAADFSGNPVEGGAPLAVAFTDKSTGTISSRSWNFGDGINSTVKNPTHTYTGEGTYTVSLTVTGPYASDTETKTDYITVTSPPAVTITRPQDGAVDVDVTISVTAVFSKEMDGATLNADTFIVEGPGGPVTGTIAYNAGTTTAVFAPYSDLEYDTSYTATLTTGITDSEGTPMALPYAWTFLTAVRPEFFYVEPYGSCAGHQPCYSTIQAAIDAAGHGDIILVCTGYYNETIVLDEPKSLKLLCGRDASYNPSALFSTANALQINSGRLIVEGLSLCGN